jgi:hypothetical protein
LSSDGCLARRRLLEIHLLLVPSHNTWLQCLKKK